jgi:putative transposase
LSDAPVGSPIAAPFHPRTLLNFNKQSPQVRSKSPLHPGNVGLKRLDRIFANSPVYGSRRLQVTLLREWISIGRRRVRRLMKKLGLWAVRPKRNTNKRHPEHKLSMPSARQDDRPVEPSAGR